MPETAEIIAQQKALMELDRAAFEEAKQRYQREIHELRRAHELDAQACDRAIAARSLELDAREAALVVRETALLEREAWAAKVSAQLKGLLDT